MIGKMYEVYYEGRGRERPNFSRRNRRQRGARRTTHLANLGEPKSLCEWLEKTIEEDLQDLTKDVNGDVLCVSKPPSGRAHKIQVMQAFKNHVRVASTETHLKT